MCICCVCVCAPICCMSPSYFALVYLREEHTSQTQNQIKFIRSTFDHLYHETLPVQRSRPFQRISKYLFDDVIMSTFDWRETRPAIEEILKHIAYIPTEYAIFCSAGPRAAK